MSKIKLFKIYSQTKINHLLPLMAASKGTIESWKTIRKVIFKYILDYQTFPKESMALFKISFFDIMVKPIITIAETTLQFIEEGDDGIKQFLNELIKNNLTQWCTCEENLSTEIKIMIQKQTSGEAYYTSEVWERNVWFSITSRLTRGAENVFSDNIIKYKKPNITIFYSNAKIHEVESRLKYLESENYAKKEENYNEVYDILLKYCAAINLNIIEGDIGDTFDQAEEKLSIITIKIENYLEDLKIEKREYIIEAIEILKGQYKNSLSEFEETNTRIITSQGRDILTEFRNKINTISKSDSRIMDILLESKKTRIIAPGIKKAGPGRPKKQLDAKVKDERNMQIDSYFKKK